MQMTAMIERGKRRGAATELGRATMLMRSKYSFPREMTYPYYRVIGRLFESGSGKRSMACPMAPADGSTRRVPLFRKNRRTLICKVALACSKASIELNSEFCASTKSRVLVDLPLRY